MTFDAALESLKRHWGFDAFRPGQDDVVKAVLDGKEVLVLFPTGGGKSLCFQVPATVLPGLTLVISPLVALMQDQVDGLIRMGISATFINSTLSQREVEQRLINARNGMYKLLYCAPERLETPLFIRNAPALNISLVAIDEAHCISEWGHEFRPPYRRIRPNLQPLIPHAKWMALTATATPLVKDDILNSLEFKDPVVVAKGFGRPNLKWWVDETEQKMDRLLLMVRKSTGSGLVYAGTRRGCTDIASEIRKLGIACEPYHAGLPSDERKRIQQNWISGKLPVVVATNAFGMGIDKPDCRWVIHYEMPGSVEAYYQEAGRAGRDGAISYPTLLVKRSDATQARSRIKQGYPSKADLQTVYDVTADTLNLAIGSDQEDPGYVSVEAVAKRGKIPLRTVALCWQSLQQFGIIEAAQPDKPQIGIHFHIGLDGLRAWIDQQPNARKKEFVDTLFRTVGPESLDAISWREEAWMLEKTGLTHNALIKSLRVLESDGILNHEQSDGLWSILLVNPRMKQLPLTPEDVERHRDRLLEKLRFMESYVNTRSCRTAYIRRYFGETSVPDKCGFCDRCLAASEDTAIDAKLVNKLLDSLKKPQTLAQLEHDLGISRKLLKNVLSLMQRENKIKAVDGRFTLP